MPAFAAASSIRPRLFTIWALTVMPCVVASEIVRCFARGLLVWLA